MIANFLTRRNNGSHGGLPRNSAISFINNNFTMDGIFYVPEDFLIGESASKLFGKTAIKVLEGEYPVSYTHSRNGTTLVHVDVR